MEYANEKNPEAGSLAPESITTVMLEPILYHYQRKIEVVISQPEFTSVCPRTGLPDFGCVTIRYTPDSHIIELKSLKYYLLQYRNVGIFYENAVNKIMEDLVSVLKPRHMAVIGDFSARGGISTSVSVCYPED